MFPATNTITMKADMSITMNTIITNTTNITIRCPRMLLQAMSNTSIATRINITTTAACMRLRISFITFRYRTR